MEHLVWAVQSTLRRHDVRDRARRLLFNHVLGTRSAINDLAALQRLAPLASPYLPWPEAAMRPCAVVAVLDEIAMLDGARVVECGGGFSTLYIGRLLREIGGSLTTVEQSEEWLDVLQGRLAVDGLEHTVELVYAPLECPPDHGGRPWYGQEALDSVGRDGIDMLVVDGPVASPDHPHIRERALAYFHDRMAPGALVVLDDVLRRGEREIVGRWRAEFGIAMDIRSLHGGIAVGRLPDH